MRIILKPMGVFVLLAAMLLLAIGALYSGIWKGAAAAAGPKSVTIPEMLTITRLPAGFSLSPEAVVYQAEDAKLSGPIATNQSGSTAKDVVVKRTMAKNTNMVLGHKDVAGYTGTGFADFQNYADDYIEWSVTVPKDGTYRLIFRYASFTNNGVRSLKITYGGPKGVASVASERLAFPNLDNWEQWGVVTTTAQLKAGANKVRATACETSGPNIDALIVDK